VDAYKLTRLCFSYTFPAAGTRQPFWYFLIYAEDALNNDTEGLDCVADVTLDGQYVISVADADQVLLSLLENG
jgi:hypothetical protein